MGDNLIPRPFPSRNPNSFPHLPSVQSVQFWLLPVCVGSHCKKWTVGSRLHVWGYNHTSCVLLAVVCNFDKKKLINCLYLCIYHSEGVNLKSTRKGFPRDLFLELRNHFFIQRGTYTAKVGLLLGNGNWTNSFVTVKLSPLNTRERQMSGLLNSSWMLIPMIYHYLLFPSPPTPTSSP